ncbi:MAG: ATP-binding protein [Syntrophobacteraceae bacterium]|jgi:signal transduction histidine kinase
MMDFQYKGFQYSDKDLLHAFMKTAQYLASLTTHEDVWRHIAELMVKFYGADSAGFASRRADGEIEFHHVVSCGTHCSFLLSDLVQESVCEVFETGFLAWRFVGSGESQCTVIFMPVAIGGETAGVMLVGHAMAGPVSNDVLNTYLAIAGLAGATITRLTSETELKRHRAHLEKLVSERTSELTLTMDRLELEIAEHMRAEKELRTIRDHLEELVETRTAELEKANRELKAYSAKLERINEELKEFAFVASHDLQEPLRKVQTFCDLVKNRCAPALDSAGQEYLDRILNSTSRMRQLLRDLLLFSRVATRPEPLSEVDLHRIVREAADVFERDIVEAGCSVEIENMPVIEANETQMLQLFRNLIGNALKYRSSESPLIKIHGRLDEHGFWQIFVGDNGIGFEQQFATLIFKPFQRLHGRGEYEGTGMGLAICRKIVELHGGSIRAESEPGKGTIFIIRLPARQTEPETSVSGKRS